MDPYIQDTLKSAIRHGKLTTEELQGWIDGLIPDAPTVSEAVATIKAGNAYSPTTVDLYEVHWDRFEEAFGDRLITEVTGPEIRELGGRIRDRAARGDDGPSGHNNDGERAHLTFHDATRALYADAYGRLKRRPDTSPVHQLKRPKPSANPNRRSLDDCELIDVFDVVAAHSWDPRLHGLLLRTYLETGARRTALLTLPLSRLDRTRCTAVLHTKNNQRHAALLTPATAAAICDLAEERGSSGRDDPAFRNKSGTPANDHTVDRLFAMIRRHLDWAADLGLSPHHLRYTHAARMERAGQSEAIAAATLGHGTKSVTQLYTSARGREVLAAWQRVFEVEHPLWVAQRGELAVPVADVQVPSACGGEGGDVR